MTVQSKQTAPIPSNETAAEPIHGAEVLDPLNRLKASPRNARKVRHTAAAIEALAASIRVKGVLQAPVVEIERDGEGAATGNYLVTIGEGRRQALRMLVKRKAIKRTHPVKVVVDRRVFSILSVAVFDRLGAFPTDFMSSMWRSISSPNVRSFADREGVGTSPRSIRPSASVPHRRASSRLRKVSLI